MMYVLEALVVDDEETVQGNGGDACDRVKCDLKFVQVPLGRFRA